MVPVVHEPHLINPGGTVVLEEDFPNWIRWAIAIAQILAPVATFILAINAIRTAKAALESAELAKTQFALSRMPAVLVQDLQARYVGTRLSVLGALGVSTEGLSPTERIGRRAVCHRVDTSIEAWAEVDGEMHVVCRNQRTDTGSRHLYDSRQPIAVSGRSSRVPNTVDIRVQYTFSSVYAPWYSETWLANATADADENGEFPVGSISHQFVRSRRYSKPYRRRIADACVAYRRWSERIRREMGG